MQAAYAGLIRPQMCNHRRRRRKDRTLCHHRHHPTSTEEEEEEEENIELFVIIDTSSYEHRKRKNIGRCTRGIQGQSHRVVVASSFIVYFIFVHYRINVKYRKRLTASDRAASRLIIKRGFAKWIHSNRSRKQTKEDLLALVTCGRTCNLYALLRVLTLDTLKLHCTTSEKHEYHQTLQCETRPDVLLRRFS